MAKPDNTQMNFTATSYTNSASSGGTFYYINFGNFKMLWGNTNSVTVGANSNTLISLNLPTGFFNTVTAVTANSANLSVNVGQYISVSSTLPITSSPASITFYMNNLGSASGTQVASIMVIGT